MNATLRDKAWARRFARHCGGDLGITHVGPRYRFSIRIWTPTRITKRKREFPVTVPANRVVPNCPVPESPYKPVEYISPSRADRDVPATPVRASPSLSPAEGSLPGQGRQSAAGSIHSSPCGCGDDAQRHWALVARDLMAEGREDELTDTMRQAYDYEFGGVPEPEPMEDFGPWN